MLDKFFTLLAFTVYLAMLAVVVGSAYTQSIIKSFFGGFAGLISSAKG